MQARDVMSKAVVSVAPETPVGRIAALLMEHGISAVPVVDHDKVIGMVSEGDLLGRSGSAAAEDRRDWWLAWVAEGHALPPGYLTSAATRERTAREVMVHPVVTIDADLDVREIATLLIGRRIKRVPVLENGKLVGIVSRADLLAAMAGEHAGTAVSRVTSTLFSAPPPLPAASGAAPAASSANGAHGPTAADFRHLVGDFRHDAARRRQEAAEEAHVQRQNLVKELISHHVADHTWNAILSAAHTAAARGERESLMLRFPSEMCSDGGRAINAPEPDWPTSLRGEAAEIYQRWLRDLQPAGFHLSARILDFPGGFPGDVGLFLVWGDEK